MKAYFKGISTLAMAVGMLTACGPSAHIVKDEEVDFSRYKTYSWTAMKDQKAVSDMMETKIREAISSALNQSKGWTENNRRPDILLSYDVLVERSVKTQSDPVYSNPFSRSYYNPYRRRYYTVYYPSQFLGYDSYSVSTREGTITITMVDARTEKTVMQGWATEELENKNINPEEIDRVVKAILKKFDKETN
jgi:hypothetical protein